MSQPNASLNSPPEEPDMLKELSTAISIVKAVPWTWLWRRVIVWWKPKLVILGPGRGGKSTLTKVLYNELQLLRRKRYRISEDFESQGDLLISFRKRNKMLLLRNIVATIGQIGAEDRLIKRNVKKVGRYEPEVLIFVFDVSEPFSSGPDESDRDPEYWLNTLIARASDKSDKDSKTFRDSLGSAKSVQLVLNKANLVYERERKKTSNDKAALDRVAAHCDEFENQVMSKLKELFASAGRNVQDFNIKGIRTCLVTYDGKKTTEYDLGHYEMLDRIVEDL